MHAGNGESFGERNKTRAAGEGVLALRNSRHIPSAWMHFHGALFSIAICVSVKFSYFTFILLPTFSKNPVTREHYARLY
jgi:hypothetical protein